MNDIRYVLQIPYLHSIFVAHPQFFSEIILPMERARSIFFGRPVRIPPLSKENMLEAIARRYDILRISSQSYIKSVSDKKDFEIWKKQGCCLRAQGRSGTVDKPLE